MATPVNQVCTPIADRPEAGENRYFVLHRFQRFQLGHDFITVTSLVRDPTSAARRCIGQAQTPEISSKPDRQLCSVGECRTVWVEEVVKQRKSHADSRTT